MMKYMSKSDKYMAVVNIWITARLMVVVNAWLAARPMAVTIIYE